MRPHAVAEFANADLDWLIHRQIYLHRIDVVQLEYTPLGAIRGRLPAHSHDPVRARYLFPIHRARPRRSCTGTLARIKARYEYLRALRYELGMLPRCDRVQVCTRENGDYLAGFLPRDSAAACDAGLRAGIDTARYEFPPGGREPFTMLFLGSFRHEPNSVALDWFVEKCCRASWRAGRKRGWWWWDPTRRRGIPTRTARRPSKSAASWKTFASRWRAMRCSSAPFAAARACA